jgi:phosphoglycerate kinase
VNVRPVSTGLISLLTITIEIQRKAMILNTIRECDFSGKKALVRVDFNVPIKDGVVTDDTRIRAALPTLTYLLDNGASLVVMSHLGRPKGKKNPEFSMAPIAKRFSELLGKDVQLANDVLGQ